MPQVQNPEQAQETRKSVKLGRKLSAKFGVNLEVYADADGSCHFSVGEANVTLAVPAGMDASAGVEKILPSLLPSPTKKNVVRVEIFGRRLGAWGYVMCATTVKTAKDGSINEETIPVSLPWNHPSAAEAQEAEDDN